MSPSRTWRRDWPLEATLTILAIVTYVPFVFTIISSFKSNPQFFTEFWLPTFPLHLENYTAAWRTIGRAILNSFTYSIPTLVLTLVISGLAGYAFARYRFPGKQILFFSILALIMIPGILLVIPMFSLIVDLNWNDTLQGVVLPWTALEVIIGIFLMRTFFETMPQELFEAARLDGADELTLLLRIAVPLAVPAFSTLAIVNLLFTWNDLLWPLIAISTAENHPVAIAVLGYAGPWQTDYGITFAGYVLASLPLIIIFGFTSRRFMDGLAGGLSI